MMKGRPLQQRCCALIFISLVQLANLERRLAKRSLQGKYACARALYRAATEVLKQFLAELESSASPAEQQSSVPGDAGPSKQEAESLSAHEQTGQSNIDAESRGSMLERPLRTAEKSFGSSAPADVRQSMRQDLVRGLQSWASMEGSLG